MNTAIRSIRWVAGALLLAPSSVIGIANAVTVNDVQSAWKQDQDIVRTMQYECGLHRTQMESVETVENPFGAPSAFAPQQLVKLESRITFSISGDKVACVSSGEIWGDTSVRTETQRFCFNGRESRRLLSAAPFSLGHIDEGVMDDSLTRHIELEPLWLAYSPTVYFDKRPAFLVSKLSIVDPEASIEGRACIELVVPLKNTRAECHIWVDPAYHYRPVRSAWRSKGVDAKSLDPATLLKSYRGLTHRQFSHDLRRSCAERLASAGVPEREIAKVLRHADVETTRKFYAPGTVQESAGIIRRKLTVPRDSETANST